MKVELLTYTPEEIISSACKVCYGNENNDKNIVSTIVHKHKHLASLRFAYAVVSVDDISISCQNQLVRSKHLDFMVQSKRYVNPYKGDFKFIYPDTRDKNVRKLLENHWNESLSLYNELLDLGLKKEDARSILPVNTSTKVRIAGNLQAYNDMFRLRLSNHAQKEIREVASKIYDLLAEVYPLVFTKEHKEELQRG